MLRREARQPSPDLRDAVARELERPCHPSSLALADAIQARHGATVAAVLFYGSCLRLAPDDDPPEGIQDFYVIVDRYRDAYEHRWQAIANRVLPPNVFYLELPWQGRTVRAKYAVVSRNQFEHGMSGAAFHPWLWARFSQMAALLHARDEDAREAMTAAIASAVCTMLTEAAPLAEKPVTARDLWLSALCQTYRAELRPEGADRAARIIDAEPERYQRMAHLVFRTERDDDLIDPAWDERTRLRTRRRWFWRRLFGKPLNVLRLMKSLFTFDGGVDYALWKVERHTGVRVPISGFERRHPILTSPMLLWRVFRLSAVR